MMRKKEKDMRTLEGKDVLGEGRKKRKERGREMLLESDRSLVRIRTGGRKARRRNKRHSLMAVQGETDRHMKTIWKSDTVKVKMEE